MKEQTGNVSYLLFKTIPVLENTILVFGNKIQVFFYTIKKADKILVLDKGRIIQEGNHEELAGVNGAYRNMILAGGGESE